MGLSAGMKSARTMQLQSQNVPVKEMFSPKEIKMLPLADIKPRTRFMLSGENKPVYATHHK